MKLITETIHDAKFLCEEKENGKKNFFIEGIFMQGGIKNRNGRIYPVDVLLNETTRYSKDKVDNATAYGELGHPMGPTINPDRISHRIVELKQIDQGGNIYGKAMILDTPMGNIARGIMESGGRLGVSSRGMGTLKETKDGCKEVQSDFFLATAADIVVDPSAPDAFVNGIMEGIDWVVGSNGEYFRQTEKAQQNIEAAVTSKSLSEERKLEIFNDFLNSLLKS